jgi:hypothetical protein
MMKAFNPLGVRRELSVILDGDGVQVGLIADRAVYRLRLSPGLRIREDWNVRALLLVKAEPDPAA